MKRMLGNVERPIADRHHVILRHLGIDISLGPDHIPAGREMERGIEIDSAMPLLSSYDEEASVERVGRRDVRPLDLIRGERSRQPAAEQIRFRPDFPLLAFLRFEQIASAIGEAGLGQKRAAIAGIKRDLFRHRFVDDAEARREGLSFACVRPPLK